MRGSRSVGTGRRLTSRRPIPTDRRRAREPFRADDRRHAIGDDDRRHAPLTDVRTDRRFEAAIGVGHFEVPREAGVDAAAAELRCAPSTAARLL